MCHHLKAPASITGRLNVETDFYAVSGLDGYGTVVVSDIHDTCACYFGITQRMWRCVIFITIYLYTFVYIYAYAGPRYWKKYTWVTP